MKVLAVETATALQSVAILDDGDVLARSDQDSKGSHARWLIPAIDRLLAGTGLTLERLDGLAVSIGPGSFTGLRVGLATMMGLRMTTGLPLAGVPTLEALAWNHPRPGPAICASLKARIGEVYWAQYQWAPDGTLCRLADERAGGLQALAEALLATDGPVIMLGEGWSEHRDALTPLLGARASTLLEGPPEAMAASAVSVGLAALDRLSRGGTAADRLSPLYVQRAEAELAWERRQAAAASGGKA